MNFDTLYDDVLARPEDDGARRVLADFLSDAGDPLGDLIRVQCDLAERGPRAPRSSRVAEASLLARHGKDWHARFAPWAYEVTFRRGFPALAWCNVTTLQRDGKNGSLLPSIDLVIELERDDDGGALLGLPLLERATTIELGRNLSRYQRHFPQLDSFWKPLAAARRLTGLHLDVLDHESDLQRLLELPQLDALTELSLRAMNVPVGDAAEALFSRLGASSALESLDLTGSDLSLLTAQLTRLVAQSSARRLFFDFGGLYSSNLRAVTAAVRRRGHAAVSIARNPGLNGAWLVNPEVAQVVRGDVGDQRAPPRAPPSGRGPLGRVGTWELVDLIGHNAGTSRWWARSGSTHGLLTSVVASAAAYGPSAHDLSRERDHLERAAHGLVGLSHPNLVRWLDYGVHRVGPWLVHELTDCREATRVLDELRARNQSFTVAEVARIGLDVCRGLMVLHQAGLMHGAVNETTVFLSPSGAARLLPLGLDTPTYYGPGSHRFLSPEQVTGAPRGVASDFFQLGVLMHVLLTQQHPFERLTDLQTLDAIAGRAGELPPTLPNRVPLALREFVDRLMATDQRFRPGSAEEILMELAMRANLPMTGTADAPARQDLDWLARAWELSRTLALWSELTDRRD